MFVKFGNACEGLIFQPSGEPELAFGPQAVCSAIFDDDGVYIFDREAKQETSQVPLKSIVTLIHYAIRHYNREEPIIFYLPRISSDLFREARVQNLLHQMFCKDGTEVKIVPV